MPDRSQCPGTGWRGSTSDLVGIDHAGTVFLQFIRQQVEMLGLEAAAEA
jgi:hypothetical protein